MRAPTTAHYKILYVDDDHDDQLLLKESLASLHADADLVCKSDGEEAISYLNSLPHDSLPSLIVLDLNMPKWSGHQALRYIKSSPGLADIPVAILSTSENKRDKELCTSLGAASYQQKPYHFSGYKAIAENLFTLINVAV